MNNDYLMAMAGSMLARQAMEDQFGFPEELSEREQFEALAQSAKKTARIQRSFDLFNLLGLNRVTRRAATEF